MVLRIIIVLDNILRIIYTSIMISKGLTEQKMNQAVKLGIMIDKGRSNRRKALGQLLARMTPEQKKQFYDRLRQSH